MSQTFHSNDLQDNLVTLLSHAAKRLRSSGLPNELAAQMERLAEQVRQPCVVAVVGRVKAGKSTFINALLGQELAKVGVTETTATINYFRYGQPHPERPVRCYWRGGRITNEDRAFLDRLQGHDEETLRRAEGIDHLEYHLLHPYLQQVTLVDTPGTGAVVSKHQDRTAEFMRLERQLRERHNKETLRLGSEADAVIYLLGPTARVNDQRFLQEFREITQGQSRALNAVGVMAKIDLQPAVLARREQLAAKAAAQFKDKLNTVIPVSAGIRRALDHLLANQQASLSRLMETLRRIPPNTLHKMLLSPQFYQHKPAPVSAEERLKLLGDMPWTVFTTIARQATDPALDVTAIINNLNTMAGFEQLNAVLERHFFKRSHFLRCHRIVHDARRILDTIKYKHLPEFQQRARKEQAQLTRFLSFIEQANGSPGVAQELESFVRTTLAKRVDVEAVLSELERAFGHLFHQLEAHNADFEALQQLEEHPATFSADELNELRALLGLYGTENNLRLPSSGAISVAYIAKRQAAWRRIALGSRDLVRRAVAERAIERLGLILSDLL